MKPWSKLQAALYNIIDARAGFQIHCVAYPMRAQWVNNTVPRFWVTIDKDIVWDFPKVCPKDELDRMYYPYVGKAMGISEAIREYIDCPLSEIMGFREGDTCWGLIPLIKMCDRRIGKEKLKAYSADNPLLKSIYDRRFQGRGAASSHQLQTNRSIISMADFTLYN